MPMKFGHPRCVLSVYERDHWRRCLRVAQRFEDSKAVDTGTNVNNRDINIVQSKAEDVEYLSSAASRYNTPSRSSRLRRMFSPRRPGIPSKLLAAASRDRAKANRP
jgi:hypothetical protein